MFSLTSKGSFKKTEDFLHAVVHGDIFSALEHFGQEGVSALRAATPIDSGETANSWTYEIKQDSGSYSIIWSNTHVEAGRPIAILLQMGHGTRTGGYVRGRDYINPAMQPIFDRMAAEAWKKVISG